jgi:vacuolar iron transporter family protein
MILTKFSFGATSAIVTSLAFIVGLSKGVNPKFYIIGSLLVIAIADNISDSLGIHIYQESELKKSKIVNMSTFTNFLTRFSLIVTFILLVYFLPMNYAIITSLVWGVSLLSVMSYKIARKQRANPYVAIIEHVAVSLIVIAISNFLSVWIMGIFTSV